MLRNRKAQFLSNYDAVVVGSGPNGLGAAIALASSGAAVLVLEAKETPGGGLRTDELTLPGFRHDVCSAIHPMAAAGSFFPHHGIEVEWLLPEIQATHPLDDGSAGVLHHSVQDTAQANSSPRWNKLFGPIVQHWSEVDETILGPGWRVPQHPFTLARLGTRALPPATVLARLFENPQSRALFAGVAAHANGSLSWPLSSSAGVGLIAAGHVGGWPCAEGGSQSIADAMVARLEALGGIVQCGSEVRTLSDLPRARSYLFDLTAWQVDRIAGDALPARVRRSWRRFRKGNGSFKIDYALSGPIPWTNPESRHAGTVHLGGTWEEVALAEATVRRGRPAERPYVLVAQQSLFDPTRAPAGQHTLWAYCHVPNGCTTDMTGPIEAQLDRFAPGWRDLILHKTTTTPSDLESYNANYVGGSIDGGASELHRVLFRPDFSVDPYRIGETDMWLCSSSTPPGGGVHGICGFQAAKSVLRSWE